MTHLTREQIKEIIENHERGKLFTGSALDLAVSKADEILRANPTMPIREGIEEAIKRVETSGVTLW